MGEGASALEYYLHKNYYKTGSLMANSCRAALLLGAYDQALQDLAFRYGRHVGLAFQVSQIQAIEATRCMRKSHPANSGGSGWHEAGRLSIKTE